ncbi:MAG: hypothetical protein QNI91_03100 [Arenicellales bacterium]|nr:hypothetical protein [Arenicellales bacterium]
MKLFYSLPKLISHANTVVTQKDFVSIDIFDTLMVRRVHDPDMVKVPVARFIANQAREMGIGISWKEVQDLRDKIETEQRARNGKEHPDHEANYDHFMVEMLRQVFANRYSDNLFNSVGDYEMKMESAIMSPRSDLVDWIRKLRMEGKKIILMSDIYLPSKYLKRLVADKGLAEYVTDVVSSADTFRAKASGTGFSLLREKYTIDTNRWLHVGDNIISDGIRPTDQGIDSLVIHDIKEKQRKGIVRLIHSLSRPRHFWKGRNVLQLMLPLEAENTEDSDLFVDGHNLFGMILGYFIHRLAEQCKQRNIKRIYFCSREGWLFFECWKRMEPYLFPDGSAPQSSYLYVSRMALSKAACANVGLTPTNSRVALLPAQNQDFVDICRVYNLDIKPLRPALKRASLEPDDKIALVPIDSTEGVNPTNPFSLLLHDTEFQTEVRRQGVPSRVALEEYLESEGFFDHEDVALVDIGWLGTIQHYLNQAIMERKDRPNIHGFLLAATRMGPYSNSEESHYIGLVFDQHQLNLATSYILTIKDILEEICRAPHPSVIGYDNSGVQVKPILRTEQDAAAKSETEQSKYYEPLQRGILQGVERYAVAISVLGYSSDFVRPWLNFLIVSRFAFPATKEIKRIKHFFHQDDFAAKRKVEKAIVRLNQSLWDLAPLKVAVLPFIRSRYFYRHISRMLRQWA